MMSHLVRPALASTLLLVPGVLMAEPTPEQSGGVTVTVTVKGLRNTKGLIRACLTQKAATFPECEMDAQAQHLTVPARNGPVGLRQQPTGW